MWEWLSRKLQDLSFRGGDSTPKRNAHLSSAPKSVTTPEPYAEPWKVDVHVEGLNKPIGVRATNFRKKTPAREQAVTKVFKEMWGHEIDTKQVLFQATVKRNDARKYEIIVPKTLAPYIVRVPDGTTVFRGKPRDLATELENAYENQ